MGSASSFLREAAAVFDPSTGDVTMAVRLQEGDVLADRFVIEHLAGRGGMGAVYRADDRVTGGPVAVKVLSGSRGDVGRFAREARVLAELSHPAIVRYVAHGALPNGAPFLAMEWLEGEDLADRLARTGLTVAESLAVARRVAEGLGAAHARSIVHRDVKPSNVLLVAGEPARTKLLDFGIVRLDLPSRAAAIPPMTRTGIVLGTVGYMSPEQAVADRALDGRTDVFALGCVLFECLVGEPAFCRAMLRRSSPRSFARSRHDFERSGRTCPPRSTIWSRGCCPSGRSERPADMATVLRELDAIGSVAGGVPQGAVHGSAGLSEGEQRIVSILLAVVPVDPGRAAAIVRRHGGDPALLANGTLLATLSGRGSTGEQVVAAAASALGFTMRSRRRALAPWPRAGRRRWAAVRRDR